MRAGAAGSTTPLRLSKQQRSISAETLARSASAQSRASPRRVRAAATTASAPPSAQDEARNSGEINRELLLRPEAEVVLGRAVRRCRPTARFVRFLQPEAADANRRTYRRPRRGRRRAAFRSWLPTSCLRVSPTKV